MALPTILAALIPAVSTVIDRLIPDKNAAEKAKAELSAELARVITQSNLAQADINRVEASHDSLFVAGWRPFIGWTCGVTLCWTFLGHDLAVWASNLAGQKDVVPNITMSDNLFELVLAMLGLSGLRTWEKITKTGK